MDSQADFTVKLPLLEAYLTGHWLTDFANFSAFVFHSLPSLNWAGFYLFDGQKLNLGPFVGRPACTEIRIGRGVCGTAFERRTPLLVPNVDEFPGHIVCDNASRSELVLPLLVNGTAIGVFDLDSPDLARFRDSDRVGLELWIAALLRRLPPAVLLGRPWA
ncbi:MAG: GAF domain-containing protein [Bdellovibrionota bacterium]